jgi:alpha-tubulin suppressor-like RCC1 family protein
MPLGSFRINSLGRRRGQEQNTGELFNLFSWGNNANGRTGLNITVDTTLTPTQVGTATNWLEVESNNAWSIAITTTGELWAWGGNTNGRLGLGDTAQRTIPTRIGSATNWAQVSAGSIHSLAVTTTGELWAWGGNTTGQLGRGNTTSPQTSPIRIGSATNWARVSAGNQHSLAITTTGELWAWGGNTAGQLGRGNTTSPQTSPIRIGSATNWAQVSAGIGNQSLAITTTGELWAWGNNDQGRLGLGDTTQRTSPTRVGSATNWAQVRTGSSHTLAVTTTGELWAWGENTSGRLGDGTTTQRTSPTRIGSATNWARVSAGNQHSLAVTTTGELWAWGNNTSGRLGLGDTTQRTSPTRVGSANGWLKVSAGTDHSIGIKN